MKKTSRYHVHPGVQMMQDWVKSLPQKTGRSLEEWILFLKAEGPSEAAERRVWLQKHHQFGTNASAWIVDYAEGKAPWEGDPESYLLAAEQYVDGMFAGPKELL